MAMFEKKISKFDIEPDWVDAFREASDNIEFEVAIFASGAKQIELKNPATLKESAVKELLEKTEKIYNDKYRKSRRIPEGAPGIGNATINGGRGNILIEYLEKNRIDYNVSWTASGYANFTYYKDDANKIEALDKEAAQEYNRRLALKPAGVPKQQNQEQIMEQLLQNTPKAPEVPEKIKDAVPFKEKKQAPKKRVRNIQVMTRLTPEEAELLKQRIEATGQTQADFIRSAILTGEIRELPKNSPELLELIKTLKDIKANLGKLGGLMKSIIKPNRANPVITQQEWDVLKKQINALNRLQKFIEKEVNKIWLS